TTATRPRRLAPPAIVLVANPATLSRWIGSRRRRCELYASAEARSHPRPSPLASPQEGFFCHSGERPTVSCRARATLAIFDQGVMVAKAESLAAGSSFRSVAISQTAW